MMSEPGDKPFPPTIAYTGKNLSQHCTVYIDKPDSRVFLERDIVCFDNTNLIVRIQGARDQYEEHIGPLSIVMVEHGEETCAVDGQHFVTDDNTYLINNLGQNIQGSVVSDPSVVSYFFGFWPGFAEDVLRSLITPADKLLDNPRPFWRQPLRFFNQNYPHDDLLSPVLYRIRNAIETTGMTHGWLEEQNHLLLVRLLAVHRNIGKEIETLPAVRASTRTEYYQRLHRARDFMEAYLDCPLTIPQIAAVACFAPHHFLRLFTQVFKETPHQYLTRRRLERAQHLLITTDRSITEICALIGFDSLGSFSWLFRKRLGVSPEKFRRFHAIKPFLR